MQRQGSIWRLVRLHAVGSAWAGGPSGTRALVGDALFARNVASLCLLL